MDIHIAVVPVYADNLCRACFKELNTAIAAEENVSVHMLEMPGLMDKLSTCISNIFVTTKMGSKYLCLDCFERVNEFYEFREMCLQSIRRFEESMESEYVIGNKNETIKSERTNSILLTSESVIEQEFDVNGVPEIFEGSLENPEDQFNKDAIGIETERMNDRLLSSEAVIKEEYELNDQEVVSNRDTAPIVVPEVLNEPAEIFEESNENDNAEINSLQKLTQKKTALELDLSAENEDVSGCKTSNDSKHGSNSYHKRSWRKGGKEVHMSVDDLETVASLKNAPISNESEGKLSFDDSRHTTSSVNVHNDLQAEVSGEDEQGEVCKATHTESKTTRKTTQARSKKKRYSCDKCQKFFNKENNFTAHIRKHEGLKPYPCTHEGCDKSYKWPEVLKIHQSSHNAPNSEDGFKRYHCTHEGCNKSFSWPETLKRHERRHKNLNIEHGLKIYHCMYEGCNKSFSWPATLKEHQSRHDNPKSYHCKHEGCNKSFSWRSDLKKHEMRHENPNSQHAINRYRCKHKGCDKSFSWPSGLRKHQKLQRHHQSHHNNPNSSLSIEKSPRQVSGNNPKAQPN